MLIQNMWYDPIKAFLSQWPLKNKYYKAYIVKT